MVLLDVLGQKWTLGFLWELYQSDRPITFRALREKCDAVSPTSLNARLKNLRELAFVELGSDGFSLTTKGEELTQRFIDLDCWAEDWAKQLEQKD